MDQYIAIGVVTTTHGVKGEIKVFPLTDDMKRYNELTMVYVENKKSMLKYNVQNVKFFKNLVILKFKEITDRDSAAMLKGLYLMVDRKDAVKLPEGSYFICDLIGCKVYDINNKLLGTVKEVLKTGSNDIYVVNSNLVKSKEILIPVIKKVVLQVNIEEKKIIVDLPKGLID